jgi:hypothetical protein
MALYEEKEQKNAVRKTHHVAQKTTAARLTTPAAPASAAKYKLAQIGSTTCRRPSNGGQKRPHIPDDVGLMIFAEAKEQLNPMILLTLMNVEGKDDIPLCLTRAAWGNAFWKPYSPASRIDTQELYAQAFIARYQAMSPKNRGYLQQLWSGAPPRAEMLLKEKAHRADFDVVMAAVSQDGDALEYACSTLRDDASIVMAAVGQNGLALRYASVGLRAEREIVMAAVSQDGMALGDAAAALQSDTEIVLRAVAQNGAAYAFASSASRGHRDVASMAVRHWGGWLYYCDATFRGDEAIVMAAVCQQGSALAHATDAMRQNPDIVMAAVNQEGGALEFADAALQSNRQIAIAAVRQDRYALRYVAEALRYDPKFLAAAC